MFEQASRIKLRFEYKGTIGVEDLWDLPLESLDEIYVELDRESRDTKENSLLARLSEKRDEGNNVLKLKIDIVEHIIRTKHAEQKMKKLEKERAAYKQQLLEIIADKEHEELRGKSREELLEIVNKM